MIAKIADSRDLPAEARRDVLHARASPRWTLVVSVVRAASSARAGFSFFSRIWKFLYSSPSVDWPRPWTTASPRPIVGRLRAHGRRATSASAS